MRISDWSSDVCSSDLKTATTASDALCKSTYVDPTESSVATGTLSNGINESNGGLQGHGNWQATQPWQDTQRQFVSWTSNNKRCTYQIRSRSSTRDRKSVV